MKFHLNKDGVIACGRFYLSNCKHTTDPNAVTCVRCKAVREVGKPLDLPPCDCGAMGCDACFSEREVE